MCLRRKVLYLTSLIVILGVSWGYISESGLALDVHPLLFVTTPRIDHATETNKKWRNGMQMLKAYSPRGTLTNETEQAGNVPFPEQVSMKALKKMSWHIKLESIISFPRCSWHLLPRCVSRDCEDWKRTFQVSCKSDWALIIKSSLIWPNCFIKILKSWWWCGLMFSLVVSKRIWIFWWVGNILK